MKKPIFFLIAMLMIAILSMNGQSIEPVFYFSDDPGTHNMGIASDGDFYYTCNGGKTLEGKISKYSFNGNFMKSYPIELDMRSIMFHPKEKLFYVNCYDGNIYKITDLEQGSYKLVYSKLYKNDQASLALDPKGKYLYYLDNGTLSIYDFASGTLKDRYKGLNSGPELGSGNMSVAVTKKNIITFNAEKQVFFVYDKKLNLKETIRYSDGDYGFSLSYANGLIFVATDGDYGLGKWYGYKLQ
jgi:WD40 repeat protein